MLKSEEHNKEGVADFGINYHNNGKKGGSLKKVKLLTIGSDVADVKDPWHMDNLPPSKERGPLKRIRLLNIDSGIVDDKDLLSPAAQSPLPTKKIKAPPMLSGDLWVDALEQHDFLDRGSTHTQIAEGEDPNFPEIWLSGIEEDDKDQNISRASEQHGIDALSKESSGLVAVNADITIFQENRSAVDTAFDFEQIPLLEYLEQEFEDLSLLDDVGLLDIDAALAAQEEALQRSLSKNEGGVTRLRKGPQAPGWLGSNSLLYVNWEQGEEAVQDALDRLGYTNIPISEATRTFIIQAARAAGLSLRQELELTTRLAAVRGQLAPLPPCDDSEADPYVVHRTRLKAEVVELERTLFYRMQWVAVKRAARYLGQGIELDDLIQYGMLGVIAGIKHFDISRQSKLLVAVNYWVFQSIKRAIGDYGRAIRLPTYLAEQLQAIKKQHKQLQMTLGRLPTQEEAADSLKISVEQLKACLNDEKRVLSLDKYRTLEYIHDGYSFQEIEEDAIIDWQDTQDEVSNQQIVEKLLTCLSEKEKQVICLRFGLNETGRECTLEEIGKIWNITRERVRQIEMRAMDRMQKNRVRLQLVGKMGKKPKEKYPIADGTLNDERNKLVDDLLDSSPKTRGRHRKADIGKNGI